MFVLNSDITIGNFRFSGAHEVCIHKSIHNFTDRATIKIPRAAKVLKENSVTNVTTGTLFKEGDAVCIKLGYNTTSPFEGDMGMLQTEFLGFVRHFIIGMPMEIECEGFVRQMQQKMDITRYYNNTSVTELLQLITAHTDVKIKVADDMPLLQIRLTHANGADICNAIKEISQNTLYLFFIEPRLLWCGFVYTQLAEGKDPFNIGEVSYRLGYNCMMDNTLQVRIPDDPVQIILGGIAANGNRVETKSKADYAIRKVKALLNNVGDTRVMQKMADELQCQRNYTGYQGQITGFLQPYCQPGYLATIIDDSYPDRNGKYLVESTTVTFGTTGATRQVELGPVLSLTPK